MEAQSLIIIAQLVLGLILVLVGINLVLVFRLKDIDPFRNWDANAINGWLFMTFLFFGVIAAVMSTLEYSGTFNFWDNAATAHGDEIDRMFRTTMWVAIVSSGITVALLFYYSFRYRNKEGRKALFYPHNNRLEIIWTAVPAVVLTLLIFDGVGVWHDIWRAVPDKDIDVHFEVTAEQFAWTARFPGADGELGHAHVSFIDLASGNTVGLDWEDSRTRDDVIPDTIVLPVKKKVKMHIRSKDVLHNASIVHFRIKMDAVPGMETYFIFTPTKTTEQMREDTGNEEFTYLMNCNQICGGGHWNMGFPIKVVEEDEYQAWLKRQTPYYEVLGLNQADEAPTPAETVEPNQAPTEEVAENVGEGAEVALLK